MAKIDKSQKVTDEKPTFTHRHVSVSYVRYPKFVSACPKCN